MIRASTFPFSSSGEGFSSTWGICSPSPRKLLKTSHIFITHAHMDHFIGFDQMLRVCFGREKELHLFGPFRITDQVAHKLSAYNRNLVEIEAPRSKLRGVCPQE